jgi:hypothetical protein
MLKFQEKVISIQVLNFESDPECPSSMNSFRLDRSPMCFRLYLEHCNRFNQKLDGVRLLISLSNNSNTPSFLASYSRVQCKL